MDSTLGKSGVAAVMVTRGGRPFMPGRRLATNALGNMFIDDYDRQDITICGLTMVV